MVVYHPSVRMHRTAGWCIFWRQGCARRRRFREEFLRNACAILRRFSGLKSRHAHRARLSSCSRFPPTAYFPSRSFLSSYRGRTEKALQDPPGALIDRDSVQQRFSRGSNRSQAAQLRHENVRFPVGQVEDPGDPAQSTGCANRGGGFRRGRNSCRRSCGTICTGGRWEKVLLFEPSEQGLFAFLPFGRYRVRYSDQILDCRLVIRQEQNAACSGADSFLFVVVVVVVVVAAVAAAVFIWLFGVKKK